MANVELEWVSDPTPPKFGRQLSALGDRINETLASHAGELGAAIEGQAKIYATTGVAPGPDVGETGNLRAGIRYHVDSSGNVVRVLVGTNVSYAGYVELGTRRSSSFPHIRPAVEENRQRIATAMENAMRAAFRGM